jgi:hypothetical protein
MTRIDKTNYYLDVAEAILEDVIVLEGILEQLL